MPLPVQEYHHGNVMCPRKCYDNHQVPPLMAGTNEVHLPCGGENISCDVILIYVVPVTIFCGQYWTRIIVCEYTNWLC